VTAEVASEGVPDEGERLAYLATLLLSRSSGGTCSREVLRAAYAQRWSGDNTIRVERPPDRTWINPRMGQRQPNRRQQFSSSVRGVRWETNRRRSNTRGQQSSEALRYDLGALEARGLARRGSGDDVLLLDRPGLVALARSAGRRAR